MSREAVLTPTQAPPKTRITLEEFLAWADEDARAEWVDGEVIMAAAANFPHQNLAGFLFDLLRTWVQFRQMGLVLYEFGMRLPRSLRVPDVLVVKNEHRERIRETYLDGPADLVVEVVSPESVLRDYQEKVQEYAQAGVPEYWIVDPAHQVVSALGLKQGAYEVLFEGREGRLESRVLPGFWLEAAWLWQEPLPDVLTVMLEIGGEDFVRYLQARLRGYTGAEDRA